MSLTRNTDDLNIIQKLDDEPNDVGGETAASLKEQFDKASNLLKTYINGVLLPELEKAGVLSLIQHGTDSCKFIRLNADGAVETSADGASWTVTASSGHLVYDANGNQFPQRSRMKFLNSTISDDGTFTVINGIKGDKGDTGAKGDTGSAATVEIGTVSTGAEGSSVIITNSGTKNAAVLNFTIPQGKKGSAWYPTVDGLGNLTFALSDTSVHLPFTTSAAPRDPRVFRERRAYRVRREIPERKVFKEFRAFRENREKQDPQAQLDLLDPPDRQVRRAPWDRRGQCRI
jgi:hypothetical protein